MTTLPRLIASQSSARSRRSELEVHVPVGTALAAALRNGLAFAPVELPDQPLELLGVQEPEVARPLDEVPAVARLDLGRRASRTGATRR